MGKNHELGTTHAKVLGWKLHWGGQDSGSREGVGEQGQEKAGARSELGQVPWAERPLCSCQHDLNRKGT